MRARTPDVVTVGAAGGEQDGPARLRAEDDQASRGTVADHNPVQTRPGRQAQVSFEELAPAPTVDAPGTAVQAGGNTGKRRWRAPRQLAGRLSWGLADQAVSSLTNAAIGVYVVRTLGAEQFGAFSLAYVTYGFALNASRGLATDPLMVRFSGADLASWRRAVRDCTGTAAVVGLVLGVIVVGASAFLPGTTRMAFLALGLTLPGLMLQDSWRYSFFALGRGSQAFINDLVWAGMLALAMGFIAVTRHQDVFYYVLAWGATAAVAASLGPVQSQVVPRLLGAWAWLSQHRDLGTRYLLEGTSGSLSAQLRAYGVDAALGLTAVATMSAANTLMGPMTILLFGMALVTLPEAARILKQSPRRLPVFCMLLSGGMAAVGLLWGVILLIALPRGLGAATIGPIWKPTYQLVLPQTVYVIGMALFAGAGTGLHALGAARRSLRTTLIGTSSTLVLTLAGAVTGGVFWSVIGLAAGSWLSALIAWLQLRTALRDSRREAASEPSKPPASRSGRHHRRPELAGDTTLAASGLSIGEVLFYARRRAGLTVGQLSHRTGIEPSIIGDIERNDYSACGGDFYARVYIRSMARVVGTDPAPLIAEYDGDAERPDETDEALLGTNTLALILPTEHSAAARRGDPLRGRGWTRIWLAFITALIVLAAVAAYLYHQSEQAAHHPAGAGITRSARPSVTTTTPAPAPDVPVQPSTISAYGNGGPRHGDHQRTAFFAIDGNPATAWQTNWYDTAKFGGLKAGTGLMLDLGRPVAVASIQIALGPAQGAAFEVRSGDAPSLAGTVAVARSAGSSGGAVALRIARPVRARYLLVWFTSLPRDPAGTYQEAVYDIALTGR